MPDLKLKEVFVGAEKELNEVAKKYGFTLSLVDHSISGIWYFFPEVPSDWEPEQHVPTTKGE